MKAKFLLMMSIIVMVLGMVTGCSQDSDEIVSVSAPVSQEQTSPDPIPQWQQERTNYAYLESGLQEANQYLVNHKLSLEDLKQIHEIANLIFGEWHTKLIKHWDERTADLMDLELFDSEYSRRDMYETLMDFPKKDEIVDDAPNIRINLKHIGERKDFFCIPIRLYYPGANKYNPGDEKRTGADIDDYGWYYTVLLIKKVPESKYGWKIFYSAPCPLGYEGPQGDKGPWIAKLNDTDDFSREGWFSVGSPVTDEEWDYYAGKRDKLPPPPYIDPVYSKVNPPLSFQTRSNQNLF